jgi:cytochrome b561
MDGAPQASGWNAGAKAFHWIMAVLVLGELLYGLRNYTLDMYDPGDGGWYARTIAIHKSVGLVVFALAVLRLAWRAVNGRPPFAASMPAWQRLAARLSHGFLYAAVLVQPILGYLQSAAFGTRTAFFGLFVLPNLVPAAWQRPASRVLWRVTQDAHSLLGLALGIVVTVHIAAALKHHYVDRDPTLKRMLPGGTP